MPRAIRDWHDACVLLLRVVDYPSFQEESKMKWTKPEFEVVELGMEVGAYAGNA